MTEKIRLLKFVLFLLLLPAHILCGGTEIYALSFTGGGWPGGYSEKRLCDEAVSEAVRKAEDYIFDHNLQGVSAVPGPCSCKHFRETITRNPVVCEATASISGQGTSSGGQTDGKMPVSSSELDTNIAIFHENMEMLDLRKQVLFTYLQQLVPSVSGKFLLQYYEFKDNYDSWIQRLEKIQKPGATVTRDILDQMSRELRDLDMISRNLESRMSEMVGPDSSVARSCQREHGELQRIFNAYQESFDPRHPPPLSRTCDHFEKLQRAAKALARCEGGSASDLSRMIGQNIRLMEQLCNSTMGRSGHAAPSRNSGGIRPVPIRPTGPGSLGDQPSALSTGRFRTK